LTAWHVHALNALSSHNARESKVSKKTEIAKRHAAYETALGNAHAAAHGAQVNMIEDRNALDCGFAWAVTHDAGFNTYCRKKAQAAIDMPASEERSRATRRYGSKHWATGWLFWGPGQAPVQSIRIHEAGARAFRDSLAHELQINVEIGSRLD
jgi:hypothetical protein